MSNGKNLRERLVKRAVELLRDKPAAELEAAMDDLGLTPAEKTEVRTRLRTPTPPPSPPNPEELRQLESFNRLVQDVRRGKAVLFLGAGVSLDVGMPSSGALVEALKALGRSYGAPVEETKEYQLPEVAGLLERARLQREAIDTLRERIQSGYNQVPAPHRRGAFRLLPYLGELNKRILTTNWDELIEAAFREAGEPFVVVRRDQELVSSGSAAHSILKLHGDFSDPDTLVISDTDYTGARNAILQRGGLAGSLWGAVSALLAHKSCIFVGYRHADKDIRLLRTLITARQMGRENRNYMVGLFDESEQRGLADWENMDVVPATASQFFLALAQELAEFANRQDDLERIFRREAAPFLEFYAPFGAGKHALLDEVERRARVEGWWDEEIIRIDLRQAPAPLTRPALTERLAAAMGQTGIKQSGELNRALDQKRRLLVLVERTEAVEGAWDELIDFISQEVAPAVKAVDERGQPRGLRSRLILSGRYRVQGWPVTYNRYAEMFPLSPFSLSAVREMVGKYTLFRHPKAAIPPPSAELVSQIYEITGRSHPGFIKLILDDVMEKATGADGFELPHKLTEEEIDGYLASFVETMRQEVWTTAPPEIQTTFARSLCVLRCMNASLLKRLADLLDDADEPQDVIQALRQVHLLTYDFPLEVVDPIIRRIHYHALRRNQEEPQRYLAAHRAAAAAWKGLLASVEDLTQIRYFQEWLYHLCNALQSDGKTQAEHWKAMRMEVEVVPFRSSQDYPVEMGLAMLQEIEEKTKRDTDRDEELLTVLLNCLGDTGYKEFRQLLMEKKSEVRL